MQFDRGGRGHGVGAERCMHLGDDWPVPRRRSATVLEEIARPAGFPLLLFFLFFSPPKLPARSHLLIPQAPTRLVQVGEGPRMQPAVIVTMGIQP